MVCGWPPKRDFQGYQLRSLLSPAQCWYLKDQCFAHSVMPPLQLRCSCMCMHIVIVSYTPVHFKRQKVKLRWRGRYLDLSIGTAKALLGVSRVSSLARGRGP